MQKKDTYKISSMLLCSSIAKGFSLLSKIALTALVGIKAMSIYSLANPLLVLVITLSSFSLPSVLSYLIAKKPYKSKKYVLSSLFLVILIGLILGIILYAFAPIISKNLLHNEKSEMTIKAICIFIPFICISSTIKGYFLGNREVLLATSSQLFEEGSRLIFIYLILEFFLTTNDGYNASLVIITMAIGEFFQSIYLVIFCNNKYYKNYKKIFTFKDIEFKNTSKEMLKIATPMTLSRLIGSFTYFLEPIIITSILTNMHFNIDEITLQYASLNTYVMPLLLLPGFFSTTLSNYLLPNLSYEIGKNNYQKGKRLFIKITTLCSIIGLIFSFIFLFFGEFILKTLYHTTLGTNYIKILALPFFIYYLETPFIATMNALGLNIKALISTILSSVIRILILIIFTSTFKVFTLCIATLISCLISLIFNGFYINRAFSNNKKRIIN